LGENLTWETGGFVESTSVFKQLYELISHIRISPSCEQEAMRVPSRLKWTALTGSLWAGKVAVHFPVFTSQMRIVSSMEPLARRLEEGLKQTQKT